MGRTHALTGVVGWLALVPAVQHFTPLGGREIAAGVLVTAGAAMLPDLDHPSGTASQSFGPITGLVSRLVVAVFGPHRHGAHSLVFAALALLGGGAAGLAGGWWTAVPVFLAATLAIGTLVSGRGLRNEAAAAALGYAAFIGEVGTAWLGFALALGCLMHLAGDALTDRPQHLTWPLGSPTPGLGLFTTDHAGERVFAFLLALTIGVLGFATVAGWDYVRAVVILAAP